jgi:hypothetical protein
MLHGLGSQHVRDREACGVRVLNVYGENVSSTTRELETIAAICGSNIQNALTTKVFRNASSG